MDVVIVQIAQRSLLVPVFLVDMILYMQHEYFFLSSFLHNIPPRKAEALARLAKASISATQRTAFNHTV